LKTIKRGAAQWRGSPPPCGKFALAPRKTASAVGLDRATLTADPSFALSTFKDWRHWKV
jgi:hypothetical protein